MREIKKINSDIFTVDIDEKDYIQYYKNYYSKGYLYSRWINNKSYGFFLKFK